MRKHQQHSPAERASYAARVRQGALAAGLLVAVAACGNGHNSSGTPSSGTTSASASESSSAPTTSSSTSASASHSATVVPPASKTSKATTAAPADCVNRAYNAMTNAQRVGQLFMTSVTSTGLTTSESQAITTGKTGSVFLKGHTTAGATAVKAVTAKVRTLASPVRGVSLGMFVSTDQEGGQVQVLNGPGFSTIPSAVTQGTWSTSTLQSNAATWGRQLAAAGVDMNLAPVADTVPPNQVTVNAPIGKLDREYGTNPSTVASHSTAFLRGMLQAKVVPTIKHFPGLGRASGNTDFTAGVTDSVTTTTDPYLQPFRAGIQAGTPFVMVSSAIYTRIDPHNQAAFSPAVIRTLLRGKLGFKGAVISDDLGNAAAVADRTPGQRAVDFVAAGGDVVLTVKPSDISPMTSAVLSRMTASSSFRSDVADSVHRVLTAKHNAGVLTCS
ncbi:glycoside hydrolase family 3 N-terminal domain-containing protein [Streptomyces sp. NBC_00448]|uniref:glycoside hydrolase family 3 N-terminal domain-containing protein n=1 Tax=Streptomyces sp. NBC_00448 TaxID=2903652 RepID=UPI002E24841E